MAPDVILEVDHVNPVKNGGDGDILNLVTSCKDCNRGKGAKKLSENQEVKAQQEQLKELNTKREQMQMMLKWRDELKRFDNEQIDAVNSIIQAVSGRALSEHGRGVVKKVIKSFGLESALKATEIAVDKYYYPQREDSISHAIDKIGGICYSLKKSCDDPMYSKRAYISGIMRNRFSYFDKSRTWKMLNSIVVDDESAEDVQNIAKDARNFTQFWQWINETFGGGF